MLDKPPTRVTPTIRQPGAAMLTVVPEAGVPATGVAAFRVVTPDPQIIRQARAQITSHMEAVQGEVLLLHNPQVT